MAAVCVPCLLLARTCDSSLHRLVYGGVGGLGGRGEAPRTRAQAMAQGRVQPVESVGLIKAVVVHRLLHAGPRAVPKDAEDDRQSVDRQSVMASRRGEVTRYSSG